jgi:hypothetical protein
MHPYGQVAPILPRWENLVIATLFPFSASTSPDQVLVPLGERHFDLFGLEIDSTQPALLLERRERIYRNHGCRSLGRGFSARRCGGIGLGSRFPTEQNRRLIEIVLQLIVTRSHLIHGDFRPKTTSENCGAGKSESKMCCSGPETLNEVCFHYIVLSVSGPA